MLVVGGVLIAIGLGTLYAISGRKPGHATRRGWLQTTGRVQRAWMEPHGGPNMPPAYHMDYTYRVGESDQLGHQVVDEDYIVLVDGFTRRLGSLREGDDLPVWHHADAPDLSTLMPDAVAGTLQPYQIAWASLIVGGTLVGMALAAG